MDKNKKKSPLKAKPLRLPGQSLDEYIHKLIEDRFVPGFLFSAIFLVLALHEWNRYFRDVPPMPWLYTVLFIVSLVYFVSAGIKLRRKLQKLKQGRDGERAVGQELEKLRSEGATVFHDISGDNYNIDHVVVSPKGVFTIETKTFSKPEKGKAIIEVKSDEVYANGRKLDRSPIVQAKAATSSIKNILKETTGKDYPVRPVVLFPGWFIESYKQKESWVLEPKALPAFIYNESDKLSDEMVRAAAYHLSRYVRTL